METLWLALVIFLVNIPIFYWAHKVSGQSNPLGVLLVLCRRTKWLRWAALGDDEYLDYLDLCMRKLSRQ